MERKLLIPYINAENELVHNVLKLAQEYENSGADEIFVYNYTGDEASREEFLLMLRELSRTIDIPFLAASHVEKFEDIKKVFYTGASRVVVKDDGKLPLDVIKAGVERFGKDKIIVEADFHGDFSSEKSTAVWAEKYKKINAAGVLLKHVDISPKLADNISAAGLPIYIRDSLVRNSIDELMELPIEGVCTCYYEGKSLLKAKRALSKSGFLVNCFDSSVKWEELKCDDNGLVPVVVQDYKTREVLMVAYTNEEAFLKTIETGKMHYYSRSRQALWCKGETSGHFQFVKNLRIDCDKDTILALVKQLGVACHTGNRSCFYRDIMKREYESRNPFEVLSEDFEVILDRKANPREGSYTNYLFDKGLDKILKKCGEEATEICIAAKNPQAEELKYEIADYLYHLMVLMAQCGLNWEDITRELANRRG